MIPPGANVIIVPHGPLAGLNFETLIPPSKQAQYWLNHAMVTVAPSLSILREETSLKGRWRKFLLVGDTIPKGKSQLPGSVSELKDIKQLFPDAYKKQLTGMTATPQHFLDSHPGDFSLLHISSHAYANKESPLDSYIVLTPDADHADGYLYAHDLMKLTLQEELVTLSACEGAAGKSLPGEGQVGLTWAVLSAGANKVVASSFKVSDRATSSFMRDFYTKLTAGDHPAKALHDTKLMLANKSAVPYFWAAFQLYTR
jgi:CHAT domain-containing protein